MTTLGSVTLSDDLILEGLETAPPIAHSQRRTLTGESVVQAAPVSGGRKLALAGDNHFTLADIEAVQALAGAGQPVTLTHHRGTFTVLIVSIEVEPAFNHADPQPGDWYSGRINLIEV